MDRFSCLLVGRFNSIAFERAAASLAFGSVDSAFTGSGRERAGPAGRACVHVKSRPFSRTSPIITLCAAAATATTVSLNFELASSFCRRKQSRGMGMGRETLHLEPASASSPLDSRQMGGVQGSVSLLPEQEPVFQIQACRRRRTDPVPACWSR